MLFYAPDTSDKRIPYAITFLEDKGFKRVKDEKKCDFVLLGVKPDKKYLCCEKPVFAGAVKGKGIIDYTSFEEFAIENAYLTAEGALSLIISESERSLINSKILITGYGRIAKALVRYLSPFTNNITVAARRSDDRINASCSLLSSVRFDELKDLSKYDFIINTVPDTVLGEKELRSIRNSTLLIELASFPYGIDLNMCRAKELNLIIAKALPSRCSPQSAGEAVGKAVIKLIEEVYP